MTKEDVVAIVVAVFISCAFRAFLESREPEAKDWELWQTLADGFLHSIYLILMSALVLSDNLACQVGGAFLAFLDIGRIGYHRLIRDTRLGAYSPKAPKYRGVSPEHFLIRRLEHILRSYLIVGYGFAIIHLACIPRIGTLSVSIEKAYGVDHCATPLLDIFYFSMVTLATLGYGDMAPTYSLGKFLVIGELIAGITGIGILLNLLSTTFSEMPKLKEIDDYRGGPTDGALIFKAFRRGIERIKISIKGSVL